MKYMLDTNICIYLIRNKSRKVHNKFSKCDEGDICISSISYAEMEYGVEKSKYKAMNEKALHSFVSDLEIAGFDGKAAEEYGSIRAELERTGKPIGPLDLLIAAHARSLGLTLVTNNTKEFDRVPGLKVENWV